MIESHNAASLEQVDRVMLHYAVLLTKEPERIDQASVEALRQVGFNDRAIHDICCVVSYFAFVNRIADGLGVELEDPEAQRDT